MSAAPQCNLSDDDKLAAIYEDNSDYLNRVRPELLGKLGIEYPALQRIGLCLALIGFNWHPRGC